MGNPNGKKVIAVVFGGRSVEHDVSVLTGLQALEALDSNRYEALPIYIDPLGGWWTGDALRMRRNYPLTATTEKSLIALTLDLTAAKLGRPQFLSSEKGLFGNKQSAIPFDLIVPAIHGSNGEDGTLQGLLTFAGIPFSGCDTLAAASTMDKLAAKRLARDADLNVLPELTISRPRDGDFLEPDKLEKDIIATFGHLEFPLIAKPVSLGSSVGVSRANTIDELLAALLQIFRMDHRAMIEPCVTPLVEYNIAVRRAPDGSLKTSAIERPKSEAEILDFQGKYLAGGKAGGPKLDGPPSEGMVSLNREIAPKELSPENEKQIRAHATRFYDMLDLAGSVRLDFLCNKETTEFWFNEANTIPGSFAYFLWEAAEERLTFRDLMSEMIEAGFERHQTHLRETSAATGGATIFRGD